MNKSGRNRMIIRMRKGAPETYDSFPPRKHTYREIAERFSISSGRVQEIVAKEARRERQCKNERDVWASFPEKYAVRLKHALMNAGINNPLDAVKYSRKDLLKMRRLGRKSVDVLEEWLEKRGLSLEGTKCECHFCPIHSENRKRRR